MESDKTYSVWVGDVEVNDYFLTKSEAERIADMWADAGWEDVIIHNTQGDK
jgi:hypothetical protein